MTPSQFLLHNTIVGEQKTVKQLSLTANLLE